MPRGRAGDEAQVCGGRGGPTRGRLDEKRSGTEKVSFRCRLERFGKSSVVLARCPQGDQSKYNYLFDSASSLLTNYRAAMNVRSTVPLDMARLGGAPAKKVPVKPASAQKPAPAAEKK